MREGVLHSSTLSSSAFLHFEEGVNALRAQMQIVRRTTAALLPSRMEEERERLREWLRALSRQTGLSLSALAEGANVKGTTLTRFVNDDDHPYSLSRTTIRKLETRYASRAPGSGVMTDRAIQAFVANEFEPVSGVKSPSEALEIIMITDDALNLQGMLQGDLCELDTSANPRPGDFVLAEVRTGLRTERIVRIYSPPYLQAHSTSLTLNKPLLLEAGRAEIAGVLVQLVRPLRNVS